MKNINEYLSTKINKDNISQYSFPEVLNFDETIKFFKSKGFSQIQYKRFIFQAETINYFTENAKSSKSPIYIIYELPAYKLIRFSNNGKISRSNPIFLCRFPRDGKENQPFTIEDEDGIQIDTFNNYHEFVNEVNKFFGWV